MKCGIEIDRIGDNFEPFVQEIFAMPLMYNKNVVVKTEPNTGEQSQKSVVVLKGVAKNDSKSEENQNITFLQDTEVVNETPDLQKILQTKNYGPVNIGKVSPFEGKPEPINRANADLHIVNADHANAKINYNASKSDKFDGSDLPCKFPKLLFSQSIYFDQRLFFSLQLIWQHFVSFTTRESSHSRAPRQLVILQCSSQICQRQLCLSLRNLT